MENNISILEQIAYYFGIKSTIGDVILYLLRPDADIKVAQKLLRQVHVKSHDKAITLEDIQEENIVNFKGLTDLIDSLCPQFSVYQTNVQNKKMLYCLLDKEKHIGLDGIAGLLFQFKNHRFSEDICEYAISKLLAALREVDRGKSLQFKPGYCSPYLINGSSSAIKVLAAIDCERFSEGILAMTDALCFDFAQRPEFLDGMLGCIDALLDVYEWSANPKYLEFAKKQLTICSIYLAHDQLEVADFIYQYQRLRKKTSV
ncbi:hypothetical protein ACMZ6Z_00530 [Streptococcus pluranimalium]|uniref:hypothetical protein n=1 Tax=Streptococcus pluranimalium TaxID=82348 RepID=UPI0039FC6752